MSVLLFCGCNNNSGGGNTDTESGTELTDSKTADSVTVTLPETDAVTDEKEKDTVAPVITIADGKTEVTVLYGEEVDLMDGVTVSDNRDSSIAVKTDGEVDTKTVGTYVKASVPRILPKTRQRVTKNR